MVALHSREIYVCWVTCVVRPCGRSGMAKGPAGRSRGALLRQHRRQGSAGAWGSGAGGLRRVVGLCPPVGAPAYGGRTPGLDQWQSVVTRQCDCLLRDLGPLLHRAGRPSSTQPFDPALYFLTLAQALAVLALNFAGRLRASPEPTVLGVTGLLSPAVRSQPWSHAWFVRARPWLARTPVPTKTADDGHAPDG